MRFVPNPLTLLAVCAVLAAPAMAQPVYKCRIDGKLSYSDRPCPGGQGGTLPPAPGGIPVGDTAGVGTGDARALLELEKARTEQARQEAIAAREQRASAREQRAATRAGHVAVKDLQRCDKLRLQHKWLEEDLAKAATPARRDAAQTKLRRQAQTMAVECPG